MGKICVYEYFGFIPYNRALELQQRLAHARVQSLIPDTLLLLQHPPVFTLGRFRGKQEIIVSKEVLRHEGIEVYHTNRGGSVTYHGPGQLVGYPIINLKGYGFGVREYIWKLEQVVIKLLGSLDIEGRRREEFMGGIWVGNEKICSIGIHVSHYVTMHGFAMNVNTNLKHFDLINPCGIKGAVMTSVSKVLDKNIEVEALVEPLLSVFAEEFDVKYEEGLGKCPTISGVRNG